MKSKFLIFFSLFIYSINLHAQFSSLPYDSEEFSKFKASKTFVVLTGDGNFDGQLIAAMTESWKVTPFETLLGSEFEKKLQDKDVSASYLFMSTNGGLHLINGGKKSLEQCPFVASSSTNERMNEPNPTDCAYRIRNMIESMLQCMDLIQQNNLKGRPWNIDKYLRNIYNARATKMPSRTLLFCEGSLGDILTKSDIAGTYPYKFEMCSKEKIAQVIAEKSTEYYYFQPVIDVRKSLSVVDPSNGEIIYYYKVVDFELPASEALKVKKGNIEDMAKKIKSNMK